MSGQALIPGLNSLAHEQQKLADLANALAVQAKAAGAALSSGLNQLASEQHKLAEFASSLVTQAGGDDGGPGFFITGLTIFVLACFVGYYVVWKVTPALHSPLMAVTNAISSVIIVGALLAAGTEVMTTSRMLGLGAVALASINIFGGFIVTQRMLHMYKKKEG